MKVQRLLFILFISAAFLNACSTGNPSGDVTVLFQPKYAKGFRVVKIENDTVIQFLTHSHSDSHSNKNQEREGEVPLGYIHSVDQSA